MLVLGPGDRAPTPAQDPLAPIRRRFLAAVEAHAFELAMLRRDAEEPASRRRALTDIMMIAHRVSGVAATLGFRSLGDVAAELDRKLGLALKSGPLELREFDGTVARFHAALHDAQIEQPG